MWLVQPRNGILLFYLINSNVNSHIWLVATLLDSAFLEYTQNSITRRVTTIYTVVTVAYLPKIKHLLAPPRGTELPSQAS